MHHIASLRYFLAVAEYGTIRGAADALHLSASAVSRQIQLLEHYFNAALFERRSSGMVLTAEGEILARRMRRTMREMTLARAEMDALRQLLSGRVQFAASEGVMAQWVLPAVAAFRRRHPGVVFEGEILDAPGIYSAVAEDKVDVGIAIFKHMRQEDIEVIEEFAKPLKAVMAHSHPLAACECLSLAAISEHPLTLLGKAFYTRQILDAAMRRHGLAINIALELNHIDLLKHYVALSGGITVLPQETVAAEMADGSLHIAAIAPEELPPTHTILCVRKDRELTAACSAFIELLRQAAPV